MSRRVTPLFAEIEQPLPGWTTRKIKRWVAIDCDPVWVVQLLRLRDGTPAEARHEELFIAWQRAVEAAHTSDLGLNQLPSPAS